MSNSSTNKIASRFWISQWRSAWGHYWSSCGPKNASHLYYLLLQQNLPTSWCFHHCPKSYLPKMITIFSTLLIHFVPAVACFKYCSELSSFMNLSPLDIWTITFCEQPDGLIPSCFFIITSIPNAIWVFGELFILVFSLSYNKLESIY